MSPNRFAYLEEWLRREPCHNSFKAWIDNNGDVTLHTCDFDGHATFTAPTIAQCIDALRESGR